MEMNQKKLAVFIMNHKMTIHLLRMEGEVVLHQIPSMVKMFIL